MKYLFITALAILGGLFAIPGVASAHHVTLTAQVSCLSDDGSWSVTWTANNSESNKTMDIIQGNGTDTDGFVDLVGGGVNFVDGTDPVFSPDPVPFSGNATAVLNYASNIASARVRVEADWVQFQGTATDTETVSKPTTPCVVDVCPNLDGVQATVPNGYFKDQQGNCVIDQCPNIEGSQATVPNGYFKDQSGNCVVDQCPNIEGGQATVPQGMIVVDGQCVTPNCQNSPAYAEEHAAECNPCQYDDSIPATDPNCRLIEVCVDGQVGEYPASKAPQDTEDCGVVRVCVDGAFAQYPERDAPTSTGDCDFVTVCVEGHIQRVTEFVQEENDLRLGACPPPDPSPTPSPTTPPVPTVVPSTPVSQVSAVVSEVLPARLPATGSGPDESGFPWMVALFAGLLGLGSSALIMGRVRRTGR